MVIDTVESQRAYIEEQQRSGSPLSIVFADAFLRGIRDLGYKSPSWALAELIDNSFQAGANTVAIRLGFAKGNASEKKPDQIAIVDDGNGMLPDMISRAVVWGGTSRHDSRKGFGRYGYGLPSASVSIAKRYTVYAKIVGAPWHAVTVDIDALAAAANDAEATSRLLSPHVAAPPEWCLRSEDGFDTGSLESGTVIVLEDLDRLRRMSGWITRRSFDANLLNDLGAIYRHWLPQRCLYVDGKLVQPLDPLFLMEHGRYFDETEVRAEAIEARTFTVETSDGKTGTISIRASVLPPDFQLLDPSQYGIEKAANNKRIAAMREFNGLLICREQRQIDCVRPKWTTFGNYDRNIKIEIDFDPVLDEHFGITTSKQQITVDDEMWERLKQQGTNCGNLYNLIRDMRKRFKALQGSCAAEAEEKRKASASPASVVAFNETTELKGAVVEPTAAQKEEADRNLEREVRRRAASEQRPEPEVREELAAEARENPWAVDYAATPEGPFFRPHRLGEQKRLVINTSHPFYSRVFERFPQARPAVEILLFVLAERELEAPDQLERIYRAERQKWSERLRFALEALVGDSSLADIAASVASSLDDGSQHEGDDAGDETAP